MINIQQIQDILSLYAKYDWQLRRVLLTNALGSSIDNKKELFGDAEITESDINAAWFSRKSGKDSESWELRRLSTTPYALIEVVGIEESAEIRQQILLETEEKLRTN